jgi:hypothetical protein
MCTGHNTCGYICQIFVYILLIFCKHFHCCLHTITSCFIFHVGWYVQIVSWFLSSLAMLYFLPFYFKHLRYCISCAVLVTSSKYICSASLINREVAVCNVLIEVEMSYISCTCLAQSKVFTLTFVSWAWVFPSEYTVCHHYKDRLHICMYVVIHLKCLWFLSNSNQNRNVSEHFNKKPKGIDMMRLVVTAIKLQFYVFVGNT